MSTPSEIPATEQKAPAPHCDPLAELEEVVGAIRASSYRLATNAIDSVSLRIRQALLRTAILLAVGALLFVGAASGMVLILVGAAQALAAALGMPLWSGLIIVGSVTIVVVVLVARTGISVANRRSLERAKFRIAQRAGANEGSANGR